jgi:hypothetical protein
MSSVSFGPPKRPRRTATETAIRFAVTCGLLAIVAYVVYGTGLVAATPRNLWVGAGVPAAYLLVPFFVDLEPDYENLGRPLVRDHSRRLPIVGWL